MCVLLCIDNNSKLSFWWGDVCQLSFFFVFFDSHMSHFWLLFPPRIYFPLLHITQLLCRQGFSAHHGDAHMRSKRLLLIMALICCQTVSGSQSGISDNSNKLFKEIHAVWGRRRKKKRNAGCVACLTRKVKVFYVIIKARSHTLIVVFSWDLAATLLLWFAINENKVNYAFPSKRKTVGKIQTLHCRSETIWKSLVKVVEITQIIIVLHAGVKTSGRLQWNGIKR